MPTTTANKVFDEALSLPSDIRMKLVEKLLASLNLSIREEIDRLWAEEAERRIAQIDREEMELIPGEKMFGLLGEKLPGTPGNELAKFAGTLPEEDAEEMRRAIEEDCERMVEGLSTDKW